MHSIKLQIKTQIKEPPKRVTMFKMQDSEYKKENFQKKSIEDKSCSPCSASILLAQKDI